MRTVTLFRQFVAALTTACFLSTGMLGTVQAASMTANTYLDSTVREQNLAVINQQLQREDVQQQLIDLGIDPTDAQARIANLPDHEIATMAEDMEAMPAGSGLLAVLGVVLVVLLVLELVGVINIFNNT